LLSVVRVALSLVNFAKLACVFLPGTSNQVVLAVAKPGGNVGGTGVKNLVRLGIVFVAVLAVGVVVRGQAKHTPTLEESLGLKDLGGPRI
jgi:hypothetical protein